MSRSPRILLPDQMQLETDTPEPTLDRECWRCKGENDLCKVCGGSGWLPHYDPDTAEIPY